MKVTVVIEEVISQSFEIEVENMDDIYEVVPRKYKNGELVVDNPTLVETSFQVIDDQNNECTNWINI